jgi:hypothetical protein
MFDVIGQQAHPRRGHIDAMGDILRVVGEPCPQTLPRLEYENLPSPQQLSPQQMKGNPGSGNATADDNDNRQVTRLMVRAKGQ